MIRSVRTIGFGFGLSMGIMDVMINIHKNRPSAFFSFFHTALPLAVAVFIMLVVYLIFWFLMGNALRRYFQLDKHALSMASAVFLGILFVSSRLFNIVSPSYTAFVNIPVFLIVCIVSFQIAAGVYYLCRLLSSTSKYEKMKRVFTFSWVLIFILGFFAYWLYIYYIRYYSIIVSFFLFLGTIIILYTFIWMFSRRWERRHLLILYTAAMAFIFVINPLIYIIQTKYQDASSGDIAESFQGIPEGIRRILLISVDTLRPDYMSCYNPDGARTPHMDQIANDGILFQRAFTSAPWTLPSFVSIMTGLPASVHTVKTIQNRVPDTLLTLAEVLKDNDYHTAAIGDNPYLTPHFNLSQGFLEYNFFPKTGVSLGNSLGSNVVSGWLLPGLDKAEASTSDLTQMAVEWLDGNHDHSFFLWLHYFDPHMPYSPPSDYLPDIPPLPSIGTSFGDDRLHDIRYGDYVPILPEREWIKLLYRSEVRYVDDNIGRLIMHLKKLGIYDETLIVFFSDHGEEFWEHGGFEHGHTLYNELLHVPFIIKLPRSLQASDIHPIEDKVAVQSIMPTVLDLCGIDFPGTEMTSPSLATMWRSPSARQKKDPLYSTALYIREDRESIAVDGMKYIRFTITPREELYDLAKDPQEQYSIAVSYPQTLKKARTLLDEFHSQSRTVRDALGIELAERVQMDDETMKRLRSLGYIK
jgi:arylsulfatase A-like enzyme